MGNRNRQSLRAAVKGDTSEELSRGMFSGQAPSSNVLEDLRRAEAEYEASKIKRIEIHAIQPDASQPRRVVPLSVRQHAADSSPAALIAAWERAAEAESGHPLNLTGLLRGELPETEIEEGQPGLITAGLLNLVDLAASIAKDGLTNPVTVSPIGDSYLLETGERRWMAYHLLYETLGEEWAKMPARVQERSVWRQATENTARDNLNAIARARQLAVLLMDLYREQGVAFQPYDALTEDGYDQPYYAQVADGSRWPTPRGSGQRLLQAMGFKTKQQLNQYRELLSLSRAIWIQADDENWTENALRAYLHPKNDADRSTTVDLQPNLPQTADSDDDDSQTPVITVNAHTRSLKERPTHANPVRVVEEGLSTIFKSLDWLGVSPEEAEACRDMFLRAADEMQARIE